VGEGFGPKVLPLTEVNGELEVQLSHQDNVPNLGDVADSVRVGDGTNVLKVNPDGSINTTSADKPVQLFNKPYDFLMATYPSSTVEVYSTKIGGPSGTDLQRATVTYIDATKENLYTVLKESWDGFAWVIG
jgi:hypothetical protein